VGHFTNRHRALIKNLILESKLQHFTRAEALAYINGRLASENIHISIEHLDRTWAHIKRNGLKRMQYLQVDRSAYLDQYFERVDEIIKLQQEQWRLFHMHPNSPLIQSRCLQELHQLTITLANLHDMAPAISDMSLELTRQRQGEGEGDETTLPTDTSLASR
jgi:hypothetical protein